LGQLHPVRSDLRRGHLDAGRADAGSGGQRARGGRVFARDAGGGALGPGGVRRAAVGGVDAPAPGGDRRGGPAPVPRETGRVRSAARRCFVCSGGGFAILKGRTRLRIAFREVLLRCDAGSTLPPPVGPAASPSFAPPWRRPPRNSTPPRCWDRPTRPPRRSIASACRRAPRPAAR